MGKNKDKIYLLGLAIAFLAAVLIAPQPARAQGKVGVVDLERAAKECKQGKRALAQLQVKAQKLEAEVTQLKTEMDKLQKDLENTSMLLNPEARRLKERDLERKVRLYRERQQDGRQEIREAQRDAFDPILQKMAKIIRDIGVKSKYSLIIEAKTTLYYPRSEDITDTIIASYDKSNP